MRISKTEEYGLRLVMSLAAAGGQLTIRELSEREGLPETTVAKVVARLRESGLVEAERGRNGGYALTVPADRLTLARVVETFDETMFDGGFCSRMTPAGAACSRADGCGLKPVWHSLTELVSNYLAGITVADVIGGARRPRRGASPVLRVSG